VGLFDTAEGARAERWFKWWKTRIGFQEQAALDRPPQNKLEVNDVVKCFARDLAGECSEDQPTESIDTSFSSLVQQTSLLKKQRN
jgi:hypothetical protein